VFRLVLGCDYLHLHPGDSELARGLKAEMSVKDDTRRGDFEPDFDSLLRDVGLQRRKLRFAQGRKLGRQRMRA